MKLTLGALLLLVAINCGGGFLFGFLAGPYYALTFPDFAAFQLSLGSLLLLWVFAENVSLNTNWWLPVLIIGAGYTVSNLLLPNDKVFLFGAKISPIKPEALEWSRGNFSAWTFTVYLDLPVTFFASHLRTAKRVYLGPVTRLLQWGVVSKPCLFLAGLMVWGAYKSNPGFWGTAYLCFMTVPYMVLGAGSRQIEHRVVQRARDIQAARILVEILRGRDNKYNAYSLYLRPFYLTGTLPLQNAKKTTMPLLVSTYTQEDHVDLESMLANVLGGKRLVALGSPGEMYGAGRIHSSEEEWFGNFCRLAEGAETIFIIPSASPGTLKEIQWLQTKKMFYKCIFIMPTSGNTKSTLQERWDAACQELLALTVKLPEYDPKGLIFVMNPSGEMAGNENLPETHPGKWQKAFVRLRTLSEKNKFTQVQGAQKQQLTAKAGAQKKTRS